MTEEGWRNSHRKVNGLSLHVVEAGPPEGPLLILLHGFPEFWWAWRHQITPLAERGYHVVAPDMRGYNLSDAPQEVDDYRLSILVTDVVALADSYGAERAGSRFRLIGHDWGGIVAWGVGIDHGDRLERLVILNAPHPDLWAKEALTHPTQALRSTYVAAFQLPSLPEAALGALDFAALRTMVLGSARDDTFKPGEIERYTEAWAHPGSLTAMLNYYRALRNRNDDPRDKPARIAPPTLILWGEQDRFLEQHVAHSALALCDKGQLTTVPNATHWLHLEEPAQVNDEIIRFFA